MYCLLLHRRRCGQRRYLPTGNRALGFGLVAWRVHCNCGRAGGPSQSGGAGACKWKRVPGVPGRGEGRTDDGRLRRRLNDGDVRMGCKDGKKRRKNPKNIQLSRITKSVPSSQVGGRENGLCWTVWSGLVWSAAYKARPTLVTWSQRADAARAQDEPACGAYRVAQTAACGAYLAGPPTSLHAVCPVVHWSPL